MLGHELERTDVERLVRVEAGVQFLVDSEVKRQTEIADLAARVTVLEKWHARVAGALALVSTAFVAAITWLFTKI